MHAQAGRICEYCMTTLPWNNCCCERCGQPLAVSAPVGVSCAACQRSAPIVTKARAPLRYSFPVDIALKKFKFQRQTVFAPAFADLLLPIIWSEFGECDALVPVPLHRWRHVTRGFNQADELCRLLAAKTGLPVRRHIVRRRATRSQSGLSAAERRKNLRGAFAIRAGTHCRFPLIIDDVITTGTTCNQMARILFAANAEKVGALTIARSGFDQ